MKMKNNFLKHQNYHSYIFFLKWLPDRIYHWRSIYTWRHFKLNWRKKRYTVQSVRFLPFIKWILYIYKQQYAFFLKNFINNSFLKCNYYYKFKSRKTVYLQTELWKDYFHILPTNITWLYLSNFNNFVFFKNAGIIQNYGVYFIFKLLNANTIVSDIELFEEFISEINLELKGMFKTTGFVEFNTSEEVDSTNNIVFFESNFCYYYNLLFLIEVYKFMYYIQIK